VCYENQVHELINQVRSKRKRGEELEPWEDAMHQRQQTGNERMSLFVQARSDSTKMKALKSKYGDNKVKKTEQQYQAWQAKNVPISKTTSLEIDSLLDGVTFGPSTKTNEIVLFKYGKEVTMTARGFVVGGIVTTSKTSHIDKHLLPKLKAPFGRDGWTSSSGNTGLAALMEFLNPHSNQSSFDLQNRYQRNAAESKKQRDIELHMVTTRAMNL
jgi:hypothetical protein